MDARILTGGPFWENAAPWACGGFTGDLPDLPELSRHVLFATSGSTGAPKWLALSKSALLESATAVNRHLQVTPDSCWGLALPLHHVGGFGVAARAFAAGCACATFAGRWDAPAFARWLAQHAVTHTSLVPTQVYDLVAARLIAPTRLRVIVVGGGHLDARTGQAARALGWPVLASYGMTEAASQIATQGLECLQWIYQPGPLPLLPIWQAATTAEQWLRIAGPALFSGTLVLGDGGRWQFERRAGTWYQTTDRVALSHRGLTPAGRADTLVKVLGELVDPVLIEGELSARSAGQLAPGTFVVVAIPDARAQHALVPVFDAAVAGEIIATVLADYALQAPGLRRLRSPVVIEGFPRSELGKPMRAEITAIVRTLTT